MRTARQLGMQRGVDVAFTPEGAVLLDEKSGRYWRLNSSGAMSLQLLLQGHSLVAVAAKLSAEFDVEPSEAERDIANLVQTLVEERLIT